MNITQEEVQLIFKLRCRVTDLKTNLRGAYDSHECGICNEEDETQEHILKCKGQTNMEKGKNVIPDYENLFHGKMSEQLEIARIFDENMKLKEKLSRKEDKT